MQPYYAKRAFEKLGEDGAVEFTKSVYKFIYRKILTKTNWGWKYNKRRLQVQTANDTDADPLKILWVNPDQIQYVCGKMKYVPDHTPPNTKHFRYPFVGIDSFGTVKDGDWDTHKDEFTEHLRYIGIKQRYVDNKPWEETDFFQKHLRVIEREDCSYRYESREELLKECHRYEQLLYDIKKKGYMTQRELSNPNLTREISVSIGRSGELLFTMHGSHRLSIAKILDIDKIPVVVRVRHTQWQELRDNIRRNGLSEEHEEVRNHPDLKDILD